MTSATEWFRILLTFFQTTPILNNTYHIVLCILMSNQIMQFFLNVVF